MLLLIGLLILISLFYGFGLQHYFTLHALKAEEVRLQNLYSLYPVAVALTFFCAYVAITAISLPLASALTLIAGMVFGFVWGTVLVAFAAAFGATLAFWIARSLFRNTVRQHFFRPLAIINEGVERDGNYYLFLLRLVPIFPFFIVNLVMGLTSIRTRNYFVVSFIGMMPGNLLYVNAGDQLGKIHSLSGLLSPSLIASLAAIGVFPLLVKKLVVHYRRA